MLIHVGRTSVRRRMAQSRLPAAIGTMRFMFAPKHEPCAVHAEHIDSVKTISNGRRPRHTHIRCDWRRGTLLSLIASVIVIDVDAHRFRSDGRFIRQSRPDLSRLRSDPSARRSTTRAATTNLNRPTTSWTTTNSRSPATNCSTTTTTTTNSRLTNCSTRSTNWTTRTQCLARRGWWCRTRRVRRRRPVTRRPTTVAGSGADSVDRYLDPFWSLAG
jgi:hypothetical protein